MFKLGDKEVSEMSVNIDPFPVIEMVMVSFCDPNGFRTTGKGKKVISRFGSLILDSQGNEKMDGTLAFDRIATTKIPFTNSSSTKESPEKL
jgi:hypothetical protein